MNNKFWIVYTLKNDARFERYETKNEAIDAAKRKAHQDTNSEPVYVLESVAVAQRPIPDIEVKTL